MNNFKKIKEQTQRIYETEAEAFAFQRDQTLFEKKWLDFFISHLNQNSRILDVGCGSAKPIAEYLINNGLSVSGIDYSKAMLNIAQKNFPDHHWIYADMTQMKLAQKYDGIIAWNSFFHLTPNEQKLVLELFSQHLCGKGILMFTAGHENGEVVGKVNGKEVYHSSLSVAEYCNVMESLSFELLKYKLSDQACQNHSIFVFQKT